MGPIRAGATFSGDVVALPNLVNKADPAGTDSPSLGDDTIRALKLALQDILGVPDNTNISAALFQVAATGLTAVVFRDSAASANAAGELQVNGTRLTFGANGVVLPGVLTVSTTSVGNVGSGEDELISYAMPAVLDANGRAVRITAWGTTAANGNNKTAILYFGATALVTSGALAINAQDWIVTATVVRTGATAQEAIAVYQNETPTTVGPNRTTPAETLSAAVTIKCTGTATSDNDIVQRGLIVELLN